MERQAGDDNACQRQKSNYKSHRVDILLRASSIFKDAREPIRETMLQGDKIKLPAMLRNVAIALTGAVFALGAYSGYAQQNMSALKPPAGAHVALIEFADMECPMCARQNP